VLATHYVFGLEVRAMNVNQLQALIVQSARFLSLVKSAEKDTPILCCKVRSGKQKEGLKLGQEKRAIKNTFEQLVLQQFLSKGKFIMRALF